MKVISRTFLAGLAVLLPGLVTLYLLYWLAVSAEAVIAGLFQWVLPDGWYLPGMGLAAAVGLVFLLGLMMRAWVVRKLFETGEALLGRVPIVRAIYGATKDVTDFFSRAAADGEEFSRVVSVRLPGLEADVLGFVTREQVHLSGPEDAETPARIAVYLPMSYQLGGYMLLLPPERVAPVDLSVHEALRLVLTAGITMKTSRIAPRR